MSTPVDFSLITKVLDKYFDFTKELGDYGFAGMTEYIPQEMLDTSKAADDEGYSFWLPIQSNISDDEISALEFLLGHALPASFKFFLKQRYFMELHLAKNVDVDFFSNKPGLLVKEFKEKIDKFYETLPPRNYLPFANYGDWGVLCFDANVKKPDNDYEIVVLDHDDGYQEKEPYAKSFIAMFELFNVELDTTMNEIRAFRNKNT